MKKLEAFSKGDGSHCGLTDLYPDKLAAFQEALASGEDFTTGWWASKKEIQSACVTVEKGTATVQVTAGMDDSPALVDTAIWEVLGGNAFAGDGYDAMKKKYPGITDWHIEQVIDEIAIDCALSGDDNSVTQTQTCDATEDSIMRAIDDTASDCEAELEGIFQGVKDHVKDWLDGMVKSWMTQEPPQEAD